MSPSYATLDHELGDEINMLRDAVHRFAQAEIAPRAASGTRPRKPSRNSRS